MVTDKTQVQEKAGPILEQIKKAKSILLHCHPSPDADSVGSALAMKFAIEQLGGKATVIKGDSQFPKAFAHFPGADQILMKSYWEIDPNEYDLMVIVDSDLRGVSREPYIEKLPEKMQVINIDHHRTNEGSGNINLVDYTYPACAELIYDLFKEIGIKIDENIAINLYMGIFTDTGGFKFEGVTQRTYLAGGELFAIYPKMSQVIQKMENSNSIHDLDFLGLGFSCLEQALENRVLLSIIPYSKIQEKQIPEVSTKASFISSQIRTVEGFAFSASLIEAKPNQVRVSIRSSDSKKYDVASLAKALGGGGHPAAAGTVMSCHIDEAKKLLINKAKELFNL